jgi:small ligand-binding sensory domain FIST
MYHVALAWAFLPLSYRHNSEYSPEMFAAALSTEVDSSRAVAEVSERIRSCLGGPPDIVWAFLAADHVPAAQSIASGLCEQLQTNQLLGCTAESIVGVGREVEEGAALSVWAARTPQTRWRLARLTMENTPDGALTSGWSDELIDQWPDSATVLMLADPFSFAADVLLAQFNQDHPSTQVIGGMASAGFSPGMNRLLCGTDVTSTGAVAVVVDGQSAPRAVVSQGCRPVGRHFVITKAERNTIIELGGEQAVKRLQDVFNSLANREKEQAQQGIHLGRVVSEYQDEFSQGDFLVRNVVGVDPSTGGLTVGDYFRPGQTVQFHVRDAETADGELRELLARVDDPPQSALVFTCNGRGTRLFQEPHHDAAAILNRWGDIPVAGMFAQGEIGPIGGGNFVHGFTASIALF